MTTIQVASSSVAHSQRAALRRPRAAVIGLFVLTGLALAMWVVNIPAIQAQTGISHGVLGGLLLLLGAGSVLAMQVSGPLVDRVGSRPVAIAGAALLVVGVVLPALAGQAWQLGAALFVLGLGNGAIDVAMNEQAVVVERGWGRPIMSSFHAFFSIGGAVGAGIGALMQTVSLPVLQILILGSALVAALSLLSIPSMLKPTRGAADGPSADESVNDARSQQGATTAVVAAASPETKALGQKNTGRLLALAGLAFLLMLAEGTANDWSALQAVEDLGQPAAAASLAYAAFAVAMTIGRFSADPVSHRFGAVQVVRVGSAVAAAGMLLVVLSPVFALTLVGWVVFGLGLAGIVPQIFTAAGNLGGNQGINISRVVSAGYVGLLAGPAVIGWLAGGIGLTLALALPLLFCLVGIVLAPQVAPRRPVSA